MITDGQVLRADISPEFRDCDTDNDACERGALDTRFVNETQIQAGSVSFLVDRTVVVGGEAGKIWCPGGVVCGAGACTCTGGADQCTPDGLAGCYYLVAFSPAFSETPVITVTVGANGNPGAADSQCMIYEESATGFKLSCFGSQYTPGIHWMAIGNPG